MAMSQRFTTVDKAILVATGNSLVVCGSSTEIENNTGDIVKIDGSTTRNWEEGGSSATIDILKNSTILYAELVWYSTVFSNVVGSLDLRSVQDNAVTFKTSKGTYDIIPNNFGSYTSTSGTIDRFRSADVTSYVQDAMGGSYSVSNVPISVPSTGLSNSRGGWTLNIIYRNNSFAPQKIIYKSGIAVAKPGQPLQTTLSGFTTNSESKNLKGHVLFSSANGEPLNGNGHLSLGPSFAELQNIGNKVNSPNPNPGTAPNNPGNGFFSGAINVCNVLSQSNSLLNINGTNALNNNDGFIPLQKVGARNKWDITSVNIGNILVPNQTLIAGQVVEEEIVGDGVQIVVFGAQISVKAPNIIASLSSYDLDNDGEYNVEVGEYQVYAVQIKNDGNLDANNVITSVSLNSATTFVPGSVVINGISSSTANITNGINLGTILAKGVVNLFFTVKINSLPNGGILNQNVNYNYQFNSGLDSITNYGKTNDLSLIVQEGKLDIIKSSSKSSVNVGEIITYNVDITNVGTELTKNLFFQDIINSDSFFVEGTVRINNISYEEFNPTEGFYLPNLPVGQSIKVEFDVTVESIPSTSKISTMSNVTYGYEFDQYEYPIMKTLGSNVLNVTVKFTDIIGERSNNNNYPVVGNTVTYLLKLVNVGNVIANNVQILEPAINGTSFVNDSVKINGVSKASLNPFNGFELETGIGVNQETNIEYKVLVNSLNTENLIENIAKIPFKYQISSQTEIIDERRDSNIVDTIANYVCMNVTKKVDKTHATLDDILYYTFEISNNGNIPATDTVFLDSLQSDISFIAGSVTINGVAYPSYNPLEGFTVDTLWPEEITEVKFRVKVKSIPNPNIVNNISSLVYSFKPNPDGSKLINTIFSNEVQTIINKASYTITKTVDKMYAQVGDPLVYITTIENTGTVPLTNMKFVDINGEFLRFNTGSVYVDGIVRSNLDPSIQFNIKNMQPGETTTIGFSTNILDSTPLGYIPNTSDVTLTYKENPNSPVITQTEKSNIVKTYVPIPNIDLSKSVDKLYCLVGDILTYSFVASNKGNTTAINTLFEDIIQSHASFVEGSVLVNDVNRPEFNPKVGFSLGEIKIGQSVNVEFKVRVDSLPTPNVIKNNASLSYAYYVDPNNQPISKFIISNIVTTIVNEYSATLTKVVDKEYATINDELEYTVTANNTGTVPLTNVIFKDLVPNGAIFIEGSVIQDGVSKPNANPNVGFTIDNILPDGNIVVIFKAKVISIPNPATIKNSATINFNYKLIPTSNEVNETLTSNLAITNIKAVNVTNTKSVSKSYATVNDIFTYTSVIENNGNTRIDNVNFTDNIPGSLSLVIGSVKIDGVPYPEYNPIIGFSLGSIDIADESIVTFNVKVDNVPQTGFVTNISNVNYKYKIDPDKEYISENISSNEVTTYINLGDLTITKSADRSVVKLNNLITYNFVITNTGNTILRNLSFKDIIQSESSFKTGSVFVAGVNRLNFNPITGFDLSDLGIGRSVNISFKVSADSIPSNNDLLNSADINYSYHINPNEDLINKTKKSNTTTVKVYDSIVSINKEVNKSVAKIGENIIYTVTIINDGNVPVENIIFSDDLDNNISFITDSVYINNAEAVGLNPNNGFNLENIEPGNTTTVSFSATVLTRPNNNIIYNFANIDYDYTIGEDVTNANINSNITETYVAFNELVVTKSVDKAYATVNDNLVYSIVVKNTGSVNATNINLKDLIPQEATFINGTVIVNGNLNINFNPISGFILPNLSPGMSNNIVFSVKVNSVPISGKINNNADITYTYKLISTETPKTTTVTSNTVTTLIRLANITINKSVDKAYATIGDILKYTVLISNVGNATCFDLIFKDIVQEEALFVDGSVMINDESYSSYNPNLGFSLSNLAGYNSVTIEFKAKVIAVPANYNIYNSASVDFKYYIDPNNQPIVSSEISNTVNTIINLGKLTVTKQVSKDYATIGDFITYTVNINNVGNVIAKNINFRDVIPVGLTLVSGSVTINGVSYSSYNPYNSFSLGSIIPGDTVVVKFDVTVTSLPNPSLVKNIANLTYFYKINPNDPDIPEILDSNTVTTQINVGSLQITKSASTFYAEEGDTINYTVFVKNNGNVIARNVIFTDNLKNDVTFNVGSVKVDNNTKPDFNPSLGFSLGDIAPLDIVKVEFSVTVIQSPVESVVLNYAVGTFNYKINPNAQDFTKSIQSNTVYTLIIIPSLVAIKSVNKAYATLLETLNYSILIKNNGNTTLSEMVFNDSLSNGGTFKAGTVTIDGSSYPEYNPILGFNLPSNLNAGSTSLISFETIVSNLPSPPVINNYAVQDAKYYVNPAQSPFSISTTSNTVSTNINIGNLTNTKSVDKLYAKVNDTVTYTSTITNTGNVTATNLVFTDTLQKELSFIIGSVMINEVVYPGLDPTIGFALPPLGVGQTVTVTFTSKITDLPIQGYVSNISNISFSYKIDPNGSFITKNQQSNEVTTNVVLGKITLVKSVDKPIATLNDELVYTIKLTNIGNVVNQNVLFQDTPSVGALFKVGTVKVNNINMPNYDPTIGFSLGSIGIGSVVTVEFTVKVESIPPTNQIKNQATIISEYVVDPKQPVVTQTTHSNIVITNIAYGNLNVTKSVDKKYATIGEEITYTVIVVNVGNINATDVVFEDPTPRNSNFVLGSVTINGTAYPNYNPSAGFNLNVMAPGQIITVIYKVKVIDLC